jgi:PTS system cellobiose-specific IIA component
MNNPEEDNSLESISFGIIAMAGDARSKAFSALSLAKEGKFAEADDMIKQANDSSLQAHNQQTELLTREAQGKHAEVDVLLVHAQDHLMTSILAIELITELIDVYKRFDTTSDKHE